jgi:hypothetical protein
METEVTSASAKTSPANVDRLEQEIAKESSSRTTSKSSSKGTDQLENTSFLE